MTPGRHCPRSLNDSIEASITSLVYEGRKKRLVLYLGAGVSIPLPSDGPKGDDVADRLRPYVASILSVEEATLAGLSLEELSERVGAEKSNALLDLKKKAAEAVGFRDMEPNYGHEIVALLMREGMVQVVSANWDCAVEVAGGRARVGIEGVSRMEDLSPPPVGMLLLFKVHGCARRPETIVLTGAEVNEPEMWARARVQSAITGGSVVFVGLGTVGAYVSEPVSKVAPRWIKDAANVHVVDPYGPSKAWQDALDGYGDDVPIISGSDEFLDGLLRATVLDALVAVNSEAEQLNQAEQAPWSKAILAGLKAFKEALQDSTGDAVLRWWRDGVSSSESGSSFIFSPAGQKALMCIALMLSIDGASPGITGEDENLTVGNERRYFEIACRPGKHWKEARKDARVRIERRRRVGLYSLGTPVTVAVPDASGVFPAAIAPVDIASARSPEADIAGRDEENIIYVSPEDAVQGRVLHEF